MTVANATTLTSLANFVGYDDPGTAAVVETNYYLSDDFVNLMGGDVALIAGATTVTATGTTGDDTINLSMHSRGMTIDAGTGADTITGTSAADTFVFAANDSLEAKMDTITDFTVADDTLDVASTDVTVAIASGAGVDVKGAIASGGGAETVTAIVTNGIVTLEGADAGDIDTLAEWIDVLEIGLVVADDDNAAFEFGGDTYFFQDNTSATGGHDIIKLTGVTGITAIDTTAAANTLLIA